MLISTIKLPNIKEEHTVTYSAFDRHATKKLLQQLYEYYNTPEDWAPRFEMVWS